MRCLDAFQLEVFEEKFSMLISVLKMMRSQHNGKYWHTAIQLHAHHAIEYRLSNKIVAINSPIDYQPGSNNHLIVATACQLL